MFEHLDIVLASKSPRRKELLERMGVSFRVIPSHIEESHPADINPHLIPQHLAEQKAQAVWQECSPKASTVVIGADSVVYLGNKILEKPADHKEAFSMLAHLSGKTHLVISGVCLLSQDKKVSFSGKTYVTFRPLDAQEIDHYIEKYQPFDKAGSYGVQDWMGLCKVSDMQGTYTNVMGLPTDLVYEGLRQF